MKAQWPSNWREISAISIVGILIHILYLGCVFIALNHDIPAGVVTLIAALQPIFTAALSFSFLKEKVIISQWIGIIIGICGVALVIQDSIYLSADILGYIVAFMATLFLTLGVLFEKKFCKNYHLIAALTIQYITASLILLIITPIIEDMTIIWKTEFILSIAWLTFMCSIASYILLFYLTRIGTAAKVSSLVYLTPPFAMIMSYFLFGDIMGLSGIIGTIIVIIGVILVNYEYRLKRQNLYGCHGG